MPELPEVETIVREMRKALVGKRLKRVFIFDRKLSGPGVDLPLQVESVERLGKYIVCNMTNGVRCLMHLRMTGELLFEKLRFTDVPLERKHQRAVFSFADGSLLRFIDVRRFGTIDWPKAKEPLPSLGSDPLSRKFTTQNFSIVLKKSSRAIKSLLLDQRKVSGIGNIYADESLWRAKINPRRESRSLGPKEVRLLILAIKNVLKEAIRKGGSTMRDYRRLDGGSGHYQKSRKVYDREGEPCLRCKAKIRRIKTGGRSSYFCPKCQE